MKNSMMLSLLLMAFAFVSCHNNTKPTGDPQPKAETANYDLAIMDQGQLILFDMKNKSAMPVEEKDSLFNMTIADNRVYYSVKRDNNTFLKFVDLNDPELKSQLAADWEVPYDLCVGTAFYCLKAPALAYYPEANILGMHYMQSPNYGYSEYRVFDLSDGKSYSADDWTGDLSEILYNPDYTNPYEGMFACAEDNGDLYYRQGDDMIFLADRLNFDIEDAFIEELPYYSVLSVDPTNRFVLFQALTHLGEDDEYQGPQCMASLDGKVQKILGDFDESYPGEWLPDGSLVYGTKDGIHLLTPDGKDEVLYPGTCFVIKQ
jgi:hypothetical protein